MAGFTALEIALAVNGRLVAEKEEKVSGVVTDSRSIRRDCLFVAIKGPKFDGHAFVREAFRKGAAVAMISDPSLILTEPEGVFVVVKDTVTALQDLAAHHRRRFAKLLVVGVTGSSGKTTVKNLAAAALSSKYATLKTEGNLNNHIGVPMTLFNLTGKHEAAVIEMGMNSPGEIARLTHIAAPSIGVITNVGSAHLGRLGSIAAVRKAKGELLGGLRTGGTAVLNADDPNSAPLLGKTGLKTVTFGWSESAAVRVVESRIAGTGGQVKVCWRKQDYSARLKLIGEKDAENAAAAFAVAAIAGVDGDRIVHALASVKPGKMRMEPVRLANGALLINDAYNANPDSTKSAIRTLSELGKGCRTIFVLGDMLELGPKAPAIHGEIGKFAARAGVGAVYAFGSLAKHAVTEAKRGGIAHAKTGKDKKRVADDIAKGLKPGDVILVKGSRGSAMEEVADRLVSTVGRA